MSAQALYALAGSLIGGAFVALINQLAVRKRTQAEVRKIDAEAERTRAETTKMLSEIRAIPARQVGRRPSPRGWYLSGSNPTDYEIGVDNTVAHSGNRSGFIASRFDNPRGWATLMQMFKADDYQGARLRLSAYIKTADLDHEAGLWMRVDGPNNEMLAFDDMGTRPISDTRDWRMYDVVLDVPGTAEAIAFGVHLEGSGQTWIDDVQFEKVDNEFPTTSRVRALLDAPVNLDFDSIDFE